MDKIPESFTDRSLVDAWYWACLGEPSEQLSTENIISGRIIPEPLQRQSAALIATGGRLKQLWGLDRLVDKNAAIYRAGDGPYPCVPTCPSELFALAWACLRMAFQSIQVRATNRLRARSSVFDTFLRRRISRKFRSASRSPDDLSHYPESKRRVSLPPRV